MRQHRDPGPNRHGRSAMEERICRSCGKPNSKRRGTICNRCHYLSRPRVPCSRCGKPSGRLAIDSRLAKPPICQPCRRLDGGSSKAEQVARYRARKFNNFVASVNRKQIFELDSYRCHLCKRKCRRSTTYLANSRVLHPLSPTIDHLIPLSKGGTHEPANCRTACFQCNSRKSDGGSGDQFALVIAV